MKANVELSKEKDKFNTKHLCMLNLWQMANCGNICKIFKKDEINILDVQRALLNKSMRKW